MKLKTLLPLLVLGVVPASASVIFIDNFTTAQSLALGDVDDDSMTPSTTLDQSGVGPAANVLGGFRSITLEQTSGDPEQVDTAKVTSSGTFTMALAPDDASYALMIWDGNTDSILDPNGLTPTDLTDGGANVYIGLSVRSDLAAPITLTFYSGVGNSSSYTFNAPALGFGAIPYTNYVIPMTSFVALGGGANFSAITAATMLIDGQTTPGVDVQIRNFAAMPTPEPSTFGLIGAGLVGLGIVRRRKK